MERLRTISQVSGNSIAASSSSSNSAADRSLPGSSRRAPNTLGPNPPHLITKSGARFSTKASNPSLPSHTSRAVGSINANSSVSASRRSRRKKKEDVARIFDSQGRDVTPLSLTSTFSTSALQQMNIMGMGMSGLVERLEEEKEQLSTSNKAQAQQQQPATFNYHIDEEERNYPTTQTSTDTEAPPSDVLIITPNDYVPLTPTSSLSLSLVPQSSPSVTISETPTLTLFSLPSYRVFEDNVALSGAVMVENSGYLELLERKKEKDKFVSSFSQTLNASERDKAIQVNPSVVTEIGVQTTAWMIWDQYNNEQINQSPTDNHEAQQEKRAEKEEEELLMKTEERSETDGAREGGGGGDGDSMSSSRSGADTDRASASGISTDVSRSDVGSSQASASMFGSSYPSSSSPSSALAAIASRASAMNPALVQLYHSPSFLIATQAIEAAVLQNIQHTQQLQYRDFPQIPEIEPVPPPITEPPPSDGNPPPASAAAVVANPPELVHLWSWCYSLLPPNISVCCFSWNKQNPDLLAAGYGYTGFPLAAAQPGMILFWSLKNPAFPHRRITTPSSVLSCDFATEYPHLLAVGMANGDVALYDIRDSHGAPMLESKHVTGKHREAVWQVKWVSKESSQVNTTANHPLAPTHTTTAPNHALSISGPAGSGGGGARNQLLMSISTDGTVQQWSMKKGLVPKEIMSLKRTNRKGSAGASGASAVSGGGGGAAANAGGSNGRKGGKAVTVAASGSGGNGAAAAAVSVDVLSRDSSGLCFDFPHSSPGQYYAGTEDGWIHKCSVSYNEQTLDNYDAHDQPVYAIKCSPFISDVFLSCSADWTCKLWSGKAATTTIQPAAAATVSSSSVISSSSSASASSATTSAPSSSTSQSHHSDSEPLLRFPCGYAEVLSVEWNPHRSCVWASVHRDGRVRLWDLEWSPLDARICIEATEHPLTCLSFAAHGQVLIVGSADGVIRVYRIEGVDCSRKNKEWSIEKEQARLEAVLAQHKQHR